ncbi:MAG: TetR family transcriptional regulator [Deltaproteobacteria bacterium]|nr:MAG: TetR family transcriptional regulator [Deltaproteobacteria bacterium]
MDRRQHKSREAIFKAFGELLDRKKYSRITVQNIIDRADVGRSTFYAHFSTKDHLLKLMCKKVFEHVFSKDLTSEETHDFSDKNNLEAYISHILYHLNDNKENLAGILSGESGELFMMYLNEYIARMFSSCISKGRMSVPPDFVINHLTGSFAETLKWWIKGPMKYSPDETARFFMAVNKNCF